MCIFPETRLSDELPIFNLVIDTGIFWDVSVDTGPPFTVNPMSSVLNHIDGLKGTIGAPETAKNDPESPVD